MDISKMSEKGDHELLKQSRSPDLRVDHGFKRRATNRRGNQESC